MRWLLIVGCGSLLACGQDEAQTTSRCTTITDLATVSPESRIAWPTNTQGDDRLEIWFVQIPSTSGMTTMVGYEPQSDGSYEERWSFELPGHLFDFLRDFDSDGYSDLLLGPRFDEPGSWGFHPVGPDGVPVATSVEVSVDEGQYPHWWNDVDGDGIPDWKGLDGDDVYLSLSASGVKVPLELGVSGPASIRRVHGDSSVLTISDGEDVEQRVGLARVGADGTLDWVWQSELGEFRRIRHAERTEDGFVLYAPDNAAPQSERADLVRLWISEAGDMEREVVIEDSPGVWMVHYDGDEYIDLSFSEDGVAYFRFGLDDGGFSEPQAAPEEIPWNDTGIHQRFDLDADGGVEVLLEYPLEDGGSQWKALSFHECD